MAGGDYEPVTVSRRIGAPANVIFSRQGRCPGAAWWRRRGAVEFAAGYPAVFANGSVGPLVAIGFAITKKGSKVLPVEVRPS
jgi:hypothetical protein